jgi:glycolate oxidase FAD binding subunit
VTTLSRLQEQIQVAISESKPLCIVGGDSKRHLGREPVGETLDVAGYSGVVEYQPTELVITVRAGTSISELQSILAEQDQSLACDPPEFDGKATVGGSLACNQSGPARPWHGSIRDHVLGVRLINGKGEHLQFGGQVMKNVAGYDVSRLQAGAMGTYGLITEVSLKVMPRPEASITVRRAADADDAIRMMNEIGASPAPLTGACWCDSSLYLRLSGPSAVIEAAAAELGGETHSEDLSFWTLLREQQLPFFDASSDWWRFSVRPNSAHVVPEGDWLINWGGAERWLAGQHDHEELERIASRCGGEVTWSRGGDRHAERLPSVSKSKRALLTKLKQAFDPAGVFNPGRLYSWM